MAIVIGVIGVLSILAAALMRGGPPGLVIYAGSAFSGGVFLIIAAIVIHRLTAIMVELREIKAIAKAGAERS